MKRRSTGFWSMLLMSFLLAIFTHAGAFGQSLQDYLEQGVKRYNISDFRGALEAWQRGLALAEKEGHKQAIGVFLTNLGVVYDNLADYPQALSYYQQALKIKREIKDRKTEGNVLNNFGVVYWNLADYPRALSYYQQALKIHREITDRKGEGADLTNLGSVYADLADYPQALSYYQQALKIKREIKDRKGEGNALNNLGAVYRNLADYPQALSYYQQALKIMREITDRQGEGNALGNLGLVYADLADYPQALSYYQQALKIHREIGVPTRAVEANIGEVYLEQGRLKAAYEVFQRLKDPIRLGRYHLKAGNYPKARDEFSRTLKIFEAQEMPTAGFLLADFIGLGLSYEGLKDYPKARDYFQKGIDLIEKQRGALGGVERERFLEAKVMGFPRLEPYHGMIRALIHERGKDSPSRSLFYAERARSRTFLEMLASRALKGKSPEDGRILEQDRGYQQELLALRKRLAVLEGLGSRAPQGELSRLKGELEQKQARYEGFLREVKLKNAELASLISVAPTPVEKIQALLDPDTTLLEYYATDEALYAWLVSREAVRVYEIALTEKELRRKVDELLLPNISNRPRKAEPVITVPVGDEARQETSEQEREKNRQRFYQVAQELYRWLLAPVEKGIRTEKLIVVPHGVLHKVPFSTLSDGRQALIDRHALSVLPAASLIEHLVKKRKPEKKSLLVLANPQTDYLPLGYAEVEGKAISALFPQSELYSREKATESLVKRRASEFNILHLATHGEFNARQPLQSGLLLARDGENDGQIQVHETFGMDLRKASLVTLSACETALSRVQGGDDLVGLSRGFLYAGTPSLLATLWKVDDPATARLMEFFYWNWQQGMSKPEALRQAQLALRRLPNYQHPYYWAPFVMIGDWK